MFGFVLIMWIHMGFNVDSDPAFNLNADPDPGPLTKANPCGSGSWPDFMHSWAMPD